MSVFYGRFSRSDDFADSSPEPRQPLCSHSLHRHPISLFLVPSAFTHPFIPFGRSLPISPLALFATELQVYVINTVSPFGYMMSSTAYQNHSVSV